MPKTTASRRPRVADGRSPLWRAHNFFRSVGLVYALVWFAIQFPNYAMPWLAAAEILVMLAWTVFTVWRFRSWEGRTNALVLADQVLISALFLGNELIMTEAQMDSLMPSVTTMWQPSMVTLAGVQWGWLGGGASGVLSALINFAIRDSADPLMFQDAVLLIGCGLLYGLAADTARASTERLSQALRAEAATAERERLARSIHDSVLQVLARVRKRGGELGGEAAELARLAGEQEIALRSLVAASPPEPGDAGEVDLVSRLQVLRTGRVQVSVPATGARLPEPVGSDVLSIVREALENVDRHAGPEARAWVLLEELPDEIVISVRDDGPGIAEGRLAEAAAEGRMGVAQSIRGRVQSLGGTISLDTAPGEGTEWEIRLPHPDRAEREVGARAAAKRMYTRWTGPSTGRSAPGSQRPGPAPRGGGEG
ncbi:MacS family sensor histidine kinase [Saccharopolyspora sp. MS10]|uniref:MacS family sensor histidine kinase n=1 Tax=Saccharopolyspora sp. MS10 TaxID=3385973 RepID=UPI0039A0ECDB